MKLSSSRCRVEAPSLPQAFLKHLTLKHFGAQILQTHPFVAGQVLGITKSVRSRDHVMVHCGMSPGLRRVPAEFQDVLGQPEGAARVSRGHWARQGEGCLLTSVAVMCAACLSCLPSLSRLSRLSQLFYWIFGRVGGTSDRLMASNTR